VTAGFGPSSKVGASVLADAVCLTVGPNNSAEGPTAPQAALPAAATAATAMGHGFKSRLPPLIFARPHATFQLPFGRM
jgi:hypothetical protein